MTLAVLGINSYLKMGDGATPVENFTTVAEVRNIAGPTETAAILDVTNHSSAGGVKEFILGLRDPGKITFDMNWIPTDPTQNQTTGLKFVFDQGTVKNYQIVLSNPAHNTLHFAGIVDNMTKAIPHDKELSMHVEIKITGPVTIT